MAEIKEETTTQKKLGRPKNETQDVPVDEQNQDRLDMEQSKGSDYITIDDLTRRWKRTFQSMAELNGTAGIGTVAAKWNKLNPFLQNQRIKEIYTQARKYDKVAISEFLSNPGSHESELRGLAWANSSSQQIYYNILRRACDIPLYHHYVVPDLFESESDYKKADFCQEDKLVHNWLDTFNIPVTFKNIALEVKREGKSSYLLRNKFVGQGKTKQTGFCTLQKMPTEWVKITGKGQLGYTISFNMMYFMNIANSPSDFGEFMVGAWEDMLTTGVVTQNAQTKAYELNVGKAADYTYIYKNQAYSSVIEAVRRGKVINYMFWLRLPYDICYTFGSDNSHPWVAPDTMGLMLKLQELTDYGQLAGLIASTPLTCVLTGEVEPIQQPRAGKNESIFSPETLAGIMEQFNQATSTNIELWGLPLHDIKLQQLNSDVNSSEIISTATENFIESAGEGGLTITDTKPNVSMVKSAQLLAASQQNYVTQQFNQVINFIVNHKLGLKYTWKVKIWGDVFSDDSEKKFLKEIVANGNIALLPKLMSAEGLSMRDTKALTDYIKSFDFYKDFMTYTQKSQEIAAAEQAKNSDESSGAGRPSLDDDEIESDATAASRDDGTNTSDNRESE